MVPFKGITRRGSAWRSRICHEGKLINLGTFQQLTAAARAYDRAAYKLIGREDSKLNFPLSEREKEELDLIGIEEFLRIVQDSLRGVKVEQKSPRLPGDRRLRNRAQSAEGRLPGRVRHVDRPEGESEPVANKVRKLERLITQARQEIKAANQRAAQAEEASQKLEALLFQSCSPKPYEAGTAELMRGEASWEEARESLEGKVEAMATESAIAKMQTRVAEAEAGVYKRRLADSEEECLKARASLAAAHRQLAELQQTTQKPLQERRDAVAVEVAASWTRLSEAEPSLRIPKDRNVDLELDPIESFRRRAVDAEATASRLRDDLAKKEQELLEQDELLASLRADKGELQQKLERANELSKMYMDEIFEAEYTNEDLERSLDSLTKEKASLLWQLHEAKKEQGLPFPRVWDSLKKERARLLSQLPEADIDEDATAPKPWRTRKAARTRIATPTEPTSPARR